MVESSQSQLDALRTEAESAKTAASTSAAELEAVRKELERALPFEKEVKEKNLLIGKLRHEAVILNDHLTKALRFLKRGKPEDNVDRQIVTNHFLHFLMLDRSDPKKFQVLQLIAALLGWTEGSFAASRYSAHRKHGRCFADMKTTRTTRTSWTCSSGGIHQLDPSRPLVAVPPHALTLLGLYARKQWREPRVPRRAVVRVPGARGPGGWWWEQGWKRRWHTDSEYSQPDEREARSGVRDA